MIPIIKHREHKSETTYEYCFEWRGEKGCGFGFPCDKDGNISVFPLSPEALANYTKCVNGTYDVINKGIRPCTHNWTEPAQAKCHCGHIIELATFTNTCEKCGRDYNMSGQELAPRSQWGEETGESVSDILSIGHTIS
jgi:hypothetical protein